MSFICFSCTYSGKERYFRQMLSSTCIRLLSSLCSRTLPRHWALTGPSVPKYQRPLFINGICRRLKQTYVCLPNKTKYILSIIEKEPRQTPWSFYTVNNQWFCFLKLDPPLKKSTKLTYESSHKPDDLHYLVLCQPTMGNQKFRKIP